MKTFRATFTVQMVCTILIGLLMGCSHDSVVEIAPGVSRELGDHRAATIADLRYDLRFAIPAARSEPITGRVIATFTLADSGPVVFDFVQPDGRVRAVSVAGDPVPYEVRNEHVIVPEGVVSAGPVAIEIEFAAGDGSLNRQDDFLYTLFVPDRAVFDFTETEPISSYLFSFVAGDFKVEVGERAGRRMAMYHRETERDRVTRNLDTIFDLHASALEWLEGYTGIPYPFEKFDLVLIPALQYGGMEHPGAILYRAGSLLLDESATQNELLGRASLIAHETAHQWFGDLVTIEWFNDVWMKETFAAFMAVKIVNPAFPDVDCGSSWRTILPRMWWIVRMGRIRSGSRSTTSMKPGHSMARSSIKRRRSSSNTSSA